MGCPCMAANEKGETKNSRGITGTKGGSVVGGSELAADDVAAARAAKFGAKREE